MMYMKTTLATLILLTQAIQGHADDPAVQNEETGIIHHGKQTLDAIQGNGRVTLDGTIVKNQVKVNGSLFAQNTKLNELDVGGHAHIVTSYVKGVSNVRGYFTAEKSRFGNDLIHAGQKLNLVKCKTKDIIIKKTLWPFADQVVELSKGTVCKGDITFERGKGRVILLDKSKVLGHVKGGKIEKDRTSK